MAKRQISPKLVALIDQRLAKNGLAQDILNRKDKAQARNLMCLAAQALVGIREKGGNNKGVEVDLIQDTVGRPMGQAWCMNFVQSIVAYTEVKLEMKSSLFVSEGCAQVWSATSQAMKVKRIPLPGAIAIWGRYDKKGKYLGGHTGIVISADEKIFYAVEGNTTGGLGEHERVIRDGGGCYFTKRSMKGDGNMKVRGFVKPF